MFEIKEHCQAEVAKDRLWKITVQFSACPSLVALVQLEEPIGAHPTRLSEKGWENKGLSSDSHIATEQNSK